MPPGEAAPRGWEAFGQQTVEGSAPLPLPGREGRREGGREGRTEGGSRSAAPRRPHSGSLRRRERARPAARRWRGRGASEGADSAREAGGAVRLSGRAAGRFGAAPTAPTGSLQAAPRGRRRGPRRPRRLRSHSAARRAPSAALAVCFSYEIAVGTRAEPREGPRGRAGAAAGAGAERRLPEPGPMGQRRGAAGRVAA